MDYVIRPMVTRTERGEEEKAKKRKTKKKKKKPPGQRQVTLRLLFFPAVCHGRPLSFFGTGPPAVDLGFMRLITSKNDQLDKGASCYHIQFLLENSNPPYRSVQHEEAH